MTPPSTPATGRGSIRQPSGEPAKRRTPARSCAINRRIAAATSAVPAKPEIAYAMRSTKKWPGNVTSGGAPIIAMPPAMKLPAASGACVTFGRSSPARASSVPAASSCCVAQAPVTTAIAIPPMIPGPESVAIPTSPEPRFEMTAYTTSLRRSFAPTARSAPPTAEVSPIPSRRSWTLFTWTISGRSPLLARIPAKAMKVTGTSTPK